MQHDALGSVWNQHTRSAPLAPTIATGASSRRTAQRRPLYTPAERVRRDATRWTLVQGILAPLQFLVFLVSAALILRYFATGRGLEAATASVLLKTALLFTIMVTGAAWEKVVFGRWLFAPAFFWEDMVSMVVIALHTLYLWTWYSHQLSVHAGFLIALAAYGTYVINAAQFLLKLRAARLDLQAADRVCAAAPEILQ